MSKFYITTAIDYTNDVIHVGHSYQKLLADALARYHKLIGDDTKFLTGTDEHGQKVEKNAKGKGVDIKKFVDEIALADKKQWDILNISYDRFFRTTDPDHIRFCQEFYLKCKEAGDIYLSRFEGLYCVDCETYYDEDELVNGHCPIHLTKEIQRISEENYFFRLSKYQDFLLEHIEKHPEFIWPEKHRNEIVSFIKSGLKDFSISRQKEKLSWGIPVPDDPNHVIYVWFDALINYLTFGVEENCWPADIHVLGKDNQRFHAIYWPAMLKSAGYELPQTILVHDFLSLNGQKISKSLGNVILPSDLVEKFGLDGVRYFLLRYGPLTGDVDISLGKITEVYNADLANGLGNTVSRIAKLAEASDFNYERKEKPKEVYRKDQKDTLNDFRVDLVLSNIWNFDLGSIEKHIDQHAPWFEKDRSKLHEILREEIDDLVQFAYKIEPFLPGTAEKIQKQFSGKIKSTSPLFPRIS